MFLFFSHTLNEAQKQDASTNLNISDFVSLPKNLQDKWTNVPADLPSLDEYSEVFKNFLSENFQKGDFILIQGDFGISFLMVEFSKQLGLVPVYATTKRISKESIVDGKCVKESVFEHVMFRKY